MTQFYVNDEPWYDLEAIAKQDESMFNQASAWFDEVLYVHPAILDSGTSYINFPVTLFDHI